MDSKDISSLLVVMSNLNNHIQLKKFKKGDLQLTFKEYQWCFNTKSCPKKVILNRITNRHSMVWIWETEILRIFLKRLSNNLGSRFKFNQKILKKNGKNNISNIGIGPKKTPWNIYWLKYCIQTFITEQNRLYAAQTFPFCLGVREFDSH